MPSYYLLCPFCGARIDLPDDETDPWQVVGCYECDTLFDFASDEILKESSDPEPPRISCL